MPTQTPAKTWKTHPAYSTLIEILAKKGAMAENDLFEELSEECSDLGYRDFNQLLLRLEVAGRIRTTSMARGKRRIEPITPQGRF